MDKKFKEKVILITFAIVLFAILMNFSSVLDVFWIIFDIFLPVLGGFLLAFILNVPMRAIEQRLVNINQNKKKPIKKSTIRFTSVLITYFSILLIVILVFTLIIPALIESVESTYGLVVEKIPVWTAYLEKHDINIEMFSKWIEDIDIKSVIEKIGNSTGSLITFVTSFITNVFSGIMTFSVAVVISFYSLLCKDDLIRQSQKLIYVVFHEKTATHFTYIVKLINETYAKFLSGQCVEACILGALIFIAFCIFRIPYAALTGLLAGVMSFIPYVGAFLACSIGAFLVLLTSPHKIILCVAIYLLVQYIETQFIYPHVVGTSVGLSPLWTLIAVLIGGKLLGLFGMIFFIPLMAVISQLAREYVNRNLSQKKDGNTVEEVKN